MQALAQLLSIGVTLLVALVTGYVTGFLVGIAPIFDPMDDDEMFHDDVFFQAGNSIRFLRPEKLPQYLSENRRKHA